MCIRDSLTVVAVHWKLILAGVTALLVVKALVLYGFARFLGLPRYHRLLFAMVLAQGGEFSFAIFNEAWDNHLMNLEQRDVLSVVVAVSMGVVPVLISCLNACRRTTAAWLICRLRRPPPPVRPMRRRLASPQTSRRPLDPAGRGGMASSPSLGAATLEPRFCIPRTARSQENAHA